MLVRVVVLTAAYCFVFGAQVLAILGASVLFMAFTNPLGPIDFRQMPLLFVECALFAFMLERWFSKRFLARDAAGGTGETG